MNNRWRLAAGLALIAIGVVALLFNFGWIRAEQLYRLAVLWPLLLVLLGAEIIAFRVAGRAAVPVTVAVAIVLIAGSVGYAALAPPAPTLEKSITATDDAGGPARLEVDLGSADVQLSAGDLSGAAASATLRYKDLGASQPRLDWDSSTRVLTISRSSGFGGLTRDRLTVELSSRVRWSLELNSGALKVSGDLAGAQLERLALNGGTLEANLGLGPPSGKVPVAADGGTVQVHLVRPDGSALVVTLNGGTNRLVVDGSQVGAGTGEVRWSSPAYPAADAYEVEVDGGVTDVTVSREG